MWTLWLWFENSVWHSEIYKLGTEVSPCIRMSSVWILNFEIVQLCVLWRERQHSNRPWVNSSETIWAVPWLESPRRVVSSCPRIGFSSNMGTAQPNQTGRKRLTTSVWHLGHGFNIFELLRYFVAHNNNAYSMLQKVIFHILFWKFLALFY